MEDKTYLSTIKHEYGNELERTARKLEAAYECNSLINFCRKVSEKLLNGFQNLN